MSITELLAETAAMRARTSSDPVVFVTKVSTLRLDVECSPSK
jgi:hypothetical protein